MTDRARRLRRPRHARQPGAAVGEGPRRRASGSCCARSARGRRTRPTRSSSAGRGSSRRRPGRSRTGAPAPSSRRRSACSARSRTRAGTGTRRTSNKLVQVAKALPLDVGAALLASSEGYTPRANNALDRAREELGETEAIANALADNLPAPKAPTRKSRRRKRKKKPADGQAAGRSPGSQGQPTGTGHAGRQRRRARRGRRAEAEATAGAAGARPRLRRGRHPTRRPNRLPPSSEDLYVLILIAIGFVAGIVTALSPCVLPVLPIVLAGGATGRRPLAIVAGHRRQLHRLHALRGLAARPARAAAGLAPQPRDRAAARWWR